MTDREIIVNMLGRNQIPYRDGNCERVKEPTDEETNTARLVAGWPHLQVRFYFKADGSLQLVLPTAVIEPEAKVMASWTGNATS